MILFADKVTRSMDEAISETERRRAIQMEFNERNGITPKTVIKRITDLEYDQRDAKLSVDTPEDELAQLLGGDAQSNQNSPSVNDLYAQIESVRAAMITEAEALRFEEAARLRDELKLLEELALKLG